MKARSGSKLLCLSLFASLDHAQKLLLLAFGYLLERIGASLLLTGNFFSLKGTRGGNHSSVLTQRYERAVLDECSFAEGRSDCRGVGTGCVGQFVDGSSTFGLNAMRKCHFSLFKVVLFKSAAKYILFLW